MKQTQDSIGEDNSQKITLHHLTSFKIRRWNRNYGYSYIINKEYGTEEIAQY